MKRRKIADGVRTYKDGSIKHWKDGVLHNENGPAAIYPDGGKFYWVNGEQHRVDGPAMICGNGDLCWMQNDGFHRVDGPAMVDADGTKSWFLFNHELTEEEYNATSAEEFVIPRALTTAEIIAEMESHTQLNFEGCRDERFI